MCTEDDYVGVKMSLQKQFKGLDIDRLDTLHFLFTGDNIIEMLRTFLQENAVDVVVLDVWADTFTGNPNNWSEVRMNLRQLHLLTKQFDCCIVLLHHNTKNSERTNPDKNKMNASQALEAKLRSIVELRLGDEDHVRYFTIIKGNYVSPALKNKPRKVEFDGDTLLFTGIGGFVNLEIRAAAAKYDKDIWVQRFVEERVDNLSFKAVRKILVEKYGANEALPGLTWFKDNVQVP